MTTITLDQLPLKTGTVADSAITHLRESGVDKKLTIADFSSKVLNYNQNINSLSQLASIVNLTALAGLTGASNKLPYFTNSGAMALTDLQSNRNAIINGDFNIWQRGNSFASIVDGAYVADRWFYSKISSAVHNITQSSDVPTVAQAGRLFKNSLKVDCQTVDSSIAAGDLVRISQRVEGFNWLPLAQRPIILSFWVKATKAGTYCAALGNSGGDRSYVAEYTVTSNTWEFKTITFTASPSAGTWNYENGIGLSLTFTLASGSTFQTTKDTWQSGSFFATANQVNACDSTSNDFFITGVQLEAGSVATPFEYRTFQQELLLCQRYFQKTYDVNTAPGTIVDGVISYFADSVSIAQGGEITYVPDMRTVPTVTVYNPATGLAGSGRQSSGTDRNFNNMGSHSSRKGRFVFAAGATPTTVWISWHATMNAEL